MVRCGAEPRRGAAARGDGGTEARERWAQGVVAKVVHGQWCRRGGERRATAPRRRRGGGATHSKGDANHVFDKMPTRNVVEWS